LVLSTHLFLGQPARGAYALEELEHSRAHSRHGAPASSIS
jgi:hypothetical protein